MLLRSAIGVKRELAKTREDGTLTYLSAFVGTNHFDETQDESGPQAYLVEVEPGTDPIIRPHFHPRRQFQVVVRGSGSVGKHSVGPGSVHYTDPNSPYGPIVSNSEGLAYFTLRARGTGDTHWMPGSKDKMGGRAGRNIVGQPRRKDDAAIAAILEPTEDGLAGYSIHLRAGQEEVAPSPEGSGGQFHIVLEGSLRVNDTELPSESVVWVGPGEDAIHLTAGKEGAVVLTMQFPVPMGPID
jgi:hypothetical protein